MTAKIVTEYNKIFRSHTQTHIYLLSWIRFMEPGCAHNTMASNDATEFCHETETNAMGESTVAHKTKANKKEANCLNATGISEATNFSIHTAINGSSNQFNFPVDQTKANWGNDAIQLIENTFLIYSICFYFLPFFYLLSAHTHTHFDFLIEFESKKYCSGFFSSSSLYRFTI